jgi:K+-sensing histidine kinase KdpD
VIFPVIRSLRTDGSNPWRESETKLNMLCPMSIIGDSELLRIAIQNLMENSLKYRHPDGEVALDLNNLSEYYEITVWNEGSGVQPDETEGIFD